MLTLFWLIHHLIELGTRGYTLISNAAEAGALSTGLTFVVTRWIHLPIPRQVRGCPRTTLALTVWSFAVPGRIDRAIAEACGGAAFTRLI